MLFRLLACPLIMIALLGFPWGARAHDHGAGSWINNEKLTDPQSGEWCCNLIDCREETENITPVPGGFLVRSTNEVISTKRVIWRSPGGWWRCRNLPAGSTRCIIGPPNGS